MASANAQKLLSLLTLEEKISLVAGASTWRTADISRIGIPNLKISDGPSGIRGDVFGDGVPAAFLPSGVGLGATWDIELLYEVGQFLAEECRDKSVSVCLAPTMCIHRHPLGGRNFESFSEDPFLTGRLGTSHVRGLQSRGIGATPKHFLANDQETNRFHINCIIPERALREVYLLPFQMTVRDANPWCMMTSYNKVNGYHSDMSTKLLTDITRDEWKWDGVFMSDWGGTNSAAASLEAGLDLEMPGPPAHRTQINIVRDIENGAIAVGHLDRSVERILQLLHRTRRFEDAGDRPELCNDTVEKREFLLRASSAGVVLLKNEEKTLPIFPSDEIKKIAIIGPNAKRVVAGGGGVPISRRRTRRAKVNRYLPSLTKSVARNPDTGLGGAAVDWFLGHDLTAQVMTTTSIEDLYYISFGDTPTEIPGETGFSFRLRTVLTPKTNGIHKLSLASIRPSKLYLDGELIIELSGEEKSTLFFTYGSDETVVQRTLVAGQDYDIRVEYKSHDRQLRENLVDSMDPMENKFQGVRLGYEEFDDSDLPSQAGCLVKSCDAAVVVVGRDKEWETEGQDITAFALPGDQVRLIRQVSAQCKRTIVVVQAGTPVDMLPWIDDVQAVLYTWYQGQELGNATASIICGEVNPSGRLPITFPRRLEDCPAFSSFPGEQGEIRYSEELFVGYRWWDLHKIEPLFPIGFGLSYCNFEITGGVLKENLLRPDRSLVITAEVRNCGGCPVPGRQTVIAWCAEKSKQRLVRPKKQICGFVKTPPLHPGEVCQVEISVDAYAVAMYDPSRASWIVDKGSQFEILLGPDGQNLVPLFPELWFPGFPKGRETNGWSKTHLASYIDNSLIVGSNEWNRIINAIKVNGIWTGLAFSEKLNNSIYMAQALISPEGDVVIHRHKLRPSGSERDMFRDGAINSFKVVNLPIGRTGMLECAEHWYPSMTFPMQAQREQLHIGCWPYALDPEDKSDNVWFNSHIVRHGTSLYALLSGAYVLMPSVGHAFILDPLCNIIADVRAEVSFEEQPILYHVIDAFGSEHIIKEHDPNAQASWAVLQQLNASFPSYIPHEQGELVPHREISIDDLKAGRFTWSE